MTQEKEEGQGSAVWIAAVEVRPGERSKMREAKPQARGAYVRMTIPASNEKAARQICSATLKADDYQLLAIDYVERLRELEWPSAEPGEPLSLEEAGFYDTLSEFDVDIDGEPSLENFYRHLGEASLRDGRVYYGPFYCWTSDDG